METENSNINFFLSKFFVAHKNDVKCVIGTPTGSIVTGSRDGSVKLWTERGGLHQEIFVIKQRKNYAVNSLAFYQSPSGDWLIFAGLKDGVIEVFNSTSSTPFTTLQNHSENVCVLYVDADRKILVSGSWDARAVLWSIDKIIQGAPEAGRELVHHKYSVWAVSSMPSEDLLILTGSADRTIKLFNQDFEEVRNFLGHTDVVRAITPVSKTEFISGSNDSTIRLWNIDTGNCIQKCNTVSGEFVYSVIKLDHKNGKRYIAAGMENGFVEIYNFDNTKLTLLQNIRVPVTSVWSLTTFRNTDIVLGTNTGFVYIYTTEESKKATEEMLQIFDAEFSDLLAKEIATQHSNKDETVTIKVALDDGVPNLELKYIKGEDPGLAAEKFIKENNLPISYYNEITEYIKVNVPEARLAEASKYRRQETQRVTVDNEKYDYAFEVQLSKDGEPLTLGYNIGEDPNYAAQRFVEKHNLPVKFLSQLSNYLCSQVPELSTDSNNFVRIGQETPENNAPHYADPFTGSGRYVPGQKLENNNHSVYNQKTASKKKPVSAFVPIQKFFQFGLEGASVKVIPKLREMNEMQEEFKLNEKQIEAINEIMLKVDFEVNDNLVETFETILKWSFSTIIPGLDVFRIALLNEKFNKAFCTVNSESSDLNKRGNQTFQRLFSILVSDPPDAIRILVCRAFTNAAVYEAGRQMILSELPNIAKIVVNQIIVPKPNLQIASTSAMANFCRILLDQAENKKIAEIGPREDILRAIINAIESLKNIGSLDSTALFRLLQAIATLMWGDSTVIQLAKSRNLKEIINQIKDMLSDENAKSICRDIIEMIYSV